MRQSFVEPIVTSCVREIRLRMISQPSHVNLIGSIQSSHKGGGKKGRKRGRGGRGVNSQQVVTATTTSLSVETTLPISAESNESHRRVCLELVETVESMLQSSVHHVGTVVLRDVIAMM